MVTRLLALNARANAALSGRIEPARIAVAAIPTGSDRARYRIRPTLPRLTRAGGDRAVGRRGRRGHRPRGPPLLAVQGTVDTDQCAGDDSRRTSSAHTVRSSCCGCSEHHTVRPTQSRNHSSLSSNGQPSRFSTTTCEAGHCARSKERPGAWAHAAHRRSVAASRPPHLDRRSFPRQC